MHLLLFVDRYGSGAKNVKGFCCVVLSAKFPKKDFPEVLFTLLNLLPPIETIELFI